MSDHPDIDSRGYAKQTVRIEWIDGYKHGEIHVMHTDGKPTCQLRGIHTRRDYNEWTPLGEQKVTCGHCLNGSMSTEVTGRPSHGGSGWSGGRTGGEVTLNPPPGFQTVDAAERQRRMARKLPLDIPWR